MHRPDQGGGQAEAERQHFEAFPCASACVSLTLTLFFWMNKFYPC
jgi:hypothetical protein